MNSSIKNILLSAIIGDALGSGVDGFTKGHIHALYRDIDDYIDPGKALKGRLDMWRKPGLYSSISQFMLILSMACARRGPCIDYFGRSVAGSPEVSGRGPGIFRNPDRVEQSFISRMKNQQERSDIPGVPCVRIIPALLPLSFRKNSEMEHIADVITGVRLFTYDLPTAASSLLFSYLLRTLMRDEDPLSDPVRKSLKAASALVDAIESNSADIFALAVNPGVLIQRIQNLREILSGVAAADMLQTAEKNICSHVNKGLKSPIIRATVNMPDALIPYSLAVSRFKRGDPSLLYYAAAEGGSAAALAALCGAVSACRPEPIIPENLVKNLVNRKKILSLADRLHTNAVPAELMDDFMQSEASLTAKEQEELRARLKHVKSKPAKKPLTRSEKEMQLARHTVASWTKLDKAKWKKEKKRREREREP